MVSDDNYVKLLQQKNESALEYFIERDGWIVKSMIARSPMLLPEDRMECMNDTFFTVWQNAGKYDGSRASFRTWVTGVTRYCILNYLKRRKRIEYLSLDDIWEIPDESGPDIPHLILEEKEEFRKLLGCLSLQDQQIFLKLFWDEMTYGEIAGEMQMETSVLYNRISRGKRKLKRFIEEG